MGDSLLLNSDAAGKPSRLAPEEQTVPIKETFPATQSMDALPELKERLVLLIGSLLVRCLNEARRIPYILDREEVVDILIKNPSLFETLVLQEQISDAEFARDRLTAQIDALRELGQFESLDALSVSFSSDGGDSPLLDPVLSQITELSRNFVVYTSNALTIFEKKFELFMDRFRDSLEAAGIKMTVLELTPKDMGSLEERAGSYLDQGQFLQAFLFGRLLVSPVITRQLVTLPKSDYSFSRNLIRRGLINEGIRQPLVKFILRTSYVSQGGWHDLFSTLLNSVCEEPGPGGLSLLTTLIAQDPVFSCNLLCRTFPELARCNTRERSAAIEERLNLLCANPEAERVQSGN